MRLLALALTVSVITACSGDGAAHGDEATTGVSSVAPDDVAAHTPTDLRHPCEAVPARAAGEVLGEPVTTREVTSELAPRTLACGYAPRQQDRDAPLLEIKSRPDPTPLDALVGLYLGVDRFRHHPVDLAGADDAEVILRPDDDVVTVFAKQGFVTHTVILGLDDIERAERVAVRLAGLVVRANR